MTLAHGTIVRIALVLVE